MAIIGAPESWARNSVTPRTDLAENKTMSKTVRREGVDGRKGNFPHGSTGRSHINEIDREDKGVAPSLAPRTRGRIGPPRSEVVGHAPDGSGKWLPTTHDRELIGNATAAHPRLEPQGQGYSASGGKHGKVSKVPTEKFEGHRRVAPAAALNGDSDPRPGYMGRGRGPIRP